MRSALLEKTTQTAAQRTFVKLEVGASEEQLSGRTLRTREAAYGIVKMKDV